MQTKQATRNPAEEVVYAKFKMNTGVVVFVCEMWKQPDLNPTQVQKIPLDELPCGEPLNRESADLGKSLTLRSELINLIFPVLSVLTFTVFILLWGKSLHLAAILVTPSGSYFGYQVQALWMGNYSLFQICRSYSLCVVWIPV